MRTFCLALLGILLAGAWTPGPWFEDSVPPSAEDRERSEGVHGSGVAVNVHSPPPGHTGGFGESTCQFCHLDYELNEEGGELTLLGLPPDGFEPDSTYRLTLRLVHPELRRAGFQAAARFASGKRRGEQAGTLVPGEGQEVQSPSYTPVSYLNHTRDGVEPTDDGRREWSFQWSVPGDLAASVVFHVAANAADGDESEWGDRIYADSIVVRPARDR